MFEKIIANQAMRVTAIANPTIGDISTIEEIDIHDMK